MDENSVSGILVRPDEKVEYWFDGVNYHSVIPEELIDAVLDASKMKRNMEEINNEEAENTR